MWWFHDGMGWWVLFSGMWMVAFWAIIIGLVVWGASRVAGGKPDRSEDDESAVDIIGKRLARGEITREQYEELESMLR